MTGFLELWLAAQLVSVVTVFGFLVGLGRPVSLPREPRVVVVVAVKGHDIEFDGFLASLFAQDYTNYRVIFAVEAADDPAVPAIETWRRRLGDRIALAVAGLGHDEGQKTTNLRAAVASVTNADEILILADADIWMDRDWIRRLVAPLTAGEADLVSGFTWLVLGDNRLSSFVLASMSAGLVTIPRLPFLNAAWGGSTALRMKTFDELGMARAWRGTLSDDLQLTNVAQRAKCRIAVPRELLPRTIVQTDGFAAVTAQARRWYLLVRMHMPATYFVTLAALTFTSAGWLVAAAGAVAANRFAAIVVAAAFGCGVLRNVGRSILVSRLWGWAGLAENRKFLVADPFVAPFAVVFSACYAWSALRMTRTRWAGITYDIRAPRQVRILSRDGRGVAGPSQKI